VTEGLFIVLLVLLAMVPLAPMVLRIAGDRAPYFLSLVPLILGILLALNWTDVESGSISSYSFDWVSGLDLTASWRLDGLSLTFSVLVLGMGALVLIYARGYMAGESGNGKFYSFLFLFMTAMVGLALSDNIITLFVFWELTSISSYMLIGHKHSTESSRNSALQALVVTGAGGLALLGGLVLLGFAADTWQISEMFQRVEVISESALTVPALVLIALGAFTKSAQTPFHFWLPNAMSAPTPVSAYLHSATMVKAGVFLLARMHPVLGDLWLWTPLLATVGGITMVGAAWQAIRETDLKRVLAYSTVSALGTMVFLLGIGHSSAIKAAITFLIAHALYKGALFMVAGSVDHETGTRDVRHLGGLRRAMPFTATAAILAAVSMAGLPPAFGYLGKETLFAATLNADSFVAVLTGAAVIGAILNFAIAGIVALKPFTGQATDTPKVAHEGLFALWIPPLLLATLGLALGLASEWIGSFTVGPASEAVYGEMIETKLELWPGFGSVLAVSAAALGLGAVTYLSLPRILTIRLSLGSGGEGVFKALNSGLLTGSSLFTRRLQNGQMSQYVSIIIIFAAVLIITAMFVREAFRWPEDTIPVRPYEVVIALGALISAGMAAITRSRLKAIAALGATGYGIAALFVIYGAPDLGMTQILVETLTVVLLVSVFRFLPTVGREDSVRRRRRDALIAISGGIAVSVVAMAAVGTTPSTSISDFFGTNSKLEAQGTNVVNTILVDFRAMDTLGEIAVLAAAAIGVVALLRLRPAGRQKK
jgi:multicomponent Na+:H+ antiporter subunit A